MNKENKIKGELYLNLDYFGLDYKTKNLIVDKLASYVKAREKEAQKELINELEKDFKNVAVINMEKYIKMKLRSFK